MIIYHQLSSPWAGIPPPIYPRGRFWNFHFICYSLIESFSRIGGSILVIGRRDKVHFEAPAVWSMVAGLGSAGTAAIKNAGKADLSHKLDAL